MLPRSPVTENRRRQAAGVPEGGGALLAGVGVNAAALSGALQIISQKKGGGLSLRCLIPDQRIGGNGGVRGDQSGVQRHAVRREQRDQFLLLGAAGHPLLVAPNGQRRQ